MKINIMKPNQFVLLAGLSLSVFLSSCDKEEILPSTPGQPSTGTPPPTTPTTPPPTDNTPPPVTANSLLTQLGTRIFRYDAQNRLVEVSYSDQPTLGYMVVYEGDKPVRLNFKGGTNYLLYTYEGDKVVEAIRYYGENLINYHYTFEYSGEKLVKKTTMSYARYDEGRLGIAEYKYDANGNLTEIVQAWSTSNRIEDLGTSSTIYWGSYDDKPNPVPFAESEVYLPGVKLFENNPGFRDVERYTYVYHESGMPQQRYTKLETHPHVPAFIDSYTYER
ncbi:hypothetical protein [Pontibacter pamirensis]|uniref:hypothetical protein n=1 Tax=Pontibacter pamirensis TaxID=2562824 RepID=UPI001F16CFAE|nr:hypothetical protein [Pontibacter pamirensis]